MSDCFASLFSLDEVRDYVHHKLCRREGLSEQVCPQCEKPLLQQGKACGLHFSVHGPRHVRPNAIWVFAENAIYFYDSRGERFLKVLLRYRFEMGAEAAAA
ncbi:MAG: hypothetical protein U0903_18560 [Planctomycetales bacterium]